MKTKRFYLILSLIVVLIIALGAVLILNWVQEIPYHTAKEAELTATVADAAGIDISSAFKMVFAEETSSASVRRYLSVKPEIKLGVHQGASKNEVLIAPAEPLEQGTIYTFMLESEGKKLSWAFQTHTPLVIADISPQHHSLEIAVTENIEIVLNQMSPIDLSLLDQYLSITPQIDFTAVQEGRVLRIIPQRQMEQGQVYQVDIKAGLPVRDSNIALSEDYSFSFETAFSEERLWQLSGEDSYLSSAVPAFSLSAENAEAISLEVALYRFSDAGSYAETLLSAVSQHPLWSSGYKYFSDLPLTNTTQLSRWSLTEDAGRVSLPQALPTGYYLLRSSYAGQSQDMLFSVSDITAYSRSYAGQTLLWLHDVEHNQALPAIVEDFASQLSVTANAAGLAEIPITDNTVYMIESAEKSLVLPCYFASSEIDRGNKNWRYLYLDQGNYRSGESLHFWGLVKPRDGSALEYERVTVMLNSLALGETVYRDFAPLTDDVFGGQFVVPDLLDGEYTLEIWQSGKQLISKQLTIGEQAGESSAENQPDNTSAPVGNSAEPELILDKAAYGIGNGFLAGSSLPGDEFLFIESGEILSKYAAGKKNVYLDSFSPDNYLNSYLQAISYQNGVYRASKPTLLKRQTDYYQMQIRASGSLSNEKSGESGILEIMVTDDQNNPLPAQLAITIYQSEQQPDIDAFADIFSDYQPVYLSAAAVEEDFSARRLFFANIKADDKGFASCSYQLPEFNGSCWVVVQAIDTGGEVRAGSIVLDYGSGQAEETALEPKAEPRIFAYQRGELSQQTRLPANSSLTVFAAEQRIDALILLWQQLFAYQEQDEDDRSALQAIAAAHAQQLLFDYGSDYVADAVGLPIDISRYQKGDGGLGEIDADISSLPLSVMAIATAPDNIDYAALNSYYRGFLERSSSRLDKCLAVTGMALYGQPVLGEINLLLEADNLSLEEQLWLLWALYSLGDNQNAGAEYQQLMTGSSELTDREMVLAAIISALSGGGEAFHLLAQATAGDAEAKDLLAIAEVLIARTMLPQLLQAEKSFVYTVDNRQFTASLAGINDFLLTGNNKEVAGFRSINGKIDYLNIYFSE